MEISKIYPEYIPFNTKGTVYVYGHNFQENYKKYGEIYVYVYGFNYFIECEYINDTTISFNYPSDLTLTTSDTLIHTYLLLLFYFSFSSFGYFL